MTLPCRRRPGRPRRHHRSASSAPARWGAASPRWRRARVRGHAGRRAARHRRARARHDRQAARPSWSRRASSTRAERDAILARIQPRRLYGGDLEAVDFVVEAATENVDDQARDLRGARSGLPRRRRPGDQHLVDHHHRASARRSTPARARDRHALHEPGAADEAGRDHPRPADGGRDLRDDARAGRAARQDDRRCRATSRASSSTAC